MLITLFLLSSACIYIKHYIKLCTVTQKVNPNAPPSWHDDLNDARSNIYAHIIDAGLADLIPHVSVKLVDAERREVELKIMDVPEEQQQAMLSAIRGTGLRMLDINIEQNKEKSNNMEKFTLTRLREQYEKQSTMNSDQPAPTLVNTQFNNAQGVFISGGNNEVHITIDKEGRISATSKKKERIVPQELMTPEAQSVLLRFQGEGLLDEAFQPIGLSRPKMAVMAHTIAEELKIKNMWSVFGNLWGENALSTAYQEGMKQQGMGLFLDRLDDILK